MDTRNTKIVCTIGPATASAERVATLIESGMDLARLNLSHGTHALHRDVLGHIRSQAAKHGRQVGVLMDLAGPKIRLGEFDGGPVRLEVGQEFRLTTGGEAGGSNRASVTHSALADEVRPGEPILLNDGAVTLGVEAVENQDVVCVVRQGGVVDSHKGVNLPETELSVRALTKKDRLDVAFGVEERVDWIALSFVRSAEDVKDLKGLLSESSSDIPVMAKIERREALVNIEEIIEAADGIMVARGDLGVETDLAQVPMVQKQIIRLARSQGVPVVTATQMLESMIEHPQPTRAEVTDVATAILDGTDAVMLSAETAVGRFPVETVKMMSRLALATESSDETTPASAGRRSESRDSGSGSPVTDAICHGTAQMVSDLGLAAVLTCTSTGYSARMMARFRPKAPIIAVTPSEVVGRRLTLSWGVRPVVSSPIESTDQMLADATQAALGSGMVNAGQQIAVLAGLPFGQSGKTNLVKVHRVETVSS